MTKLYFRYGTVSSSKTLELLVTAHNYERQNKKVLVGKPIIDTRFGQDIVKTRVGLERKADLILQGSSRKLLEKIANNSPLDCILIDEAQFLETDTVDTLRTIVSDYNIPVICYGLKADFRGDLFPGSKRLLECADKIEEIKTICTYCQAKATMNMKLVNNIPTLKGPSIELGAEELYLPTCWSCWYDNTH